MSVDTVLKIPRARFSPDDVFESGQAFRFEKSQTGYAGVAKGRVIETVEAGEFVEVRSDLSETDLRRYLDLERDYALLFPDADEVLSEAIASAPGLRVLNQEPFETLISFIISANNNIKRIRRIVAAIAKEAGDRTEDGRMYAFPLPNSWRRCRKRVCASWGAVTGLRISPPPAASPRIRILTRCALFPMKRRNSG